MKCQICSAPNAIITYDSEFLCENCAEKSGYEICTDSGEYCKDVGSSVCFNCDHYSG